jgi:hypothetical protein
MSEKKPRIKIVDLPKDAHKSISEEELRHVAGGALIRTSSLLSSRTLLGDGSVRPSSFFEAWPCKWNV